MTGARIRRHNFTINYSLIGNRAEGRTYRWILPVEVAIVARTEIHFPTGFESNCSVSVEL